MKIVIVRLDLDRCELDVIERLVVDCLITVGEATESRVVCEMSEYDKLVWIRSVQSRKAA